MSNIYKKITVGNALAVAVALPLAANVTAATAASSPAIAAQAAQAGEVQIIRINATTVELVFANQRRVAVGFSGGGISTAMAFSVSSKTITTG